MVSVNLKRNRLGKGEGEGPPYFYEIHLGGNHKVQPRVPVYWRPNESPDLLMREIWSCEVAGTRLEKANLQALGKAVEQTVQGLLKGSSLPSHFLYLRPRGFWIPVYPERRGGYRAYLLGGLQFAGDDLEELWGKTCRHLREVDRLSDSSELAVYLCAGENLQLCPPGLTFRYEKRGGVSWIPVFYRKAVTGGIEICCDAPGLEGGNGWTRHLEDLWSLRNRIVARLVGSGAIGSPGDLWLAEVRPEIREALEKFLARSEFVFAYYDESRGVAEKVRVPVWRWHDELLGYIETLGGLSVIYFGGQLEDLGSKISYALVERKIISDPGYLNVEKRA